MKNVNSTILSVTAASIIVIYGCTSGGSRKFGDTIIEKWADGKSGAVSLTFDDGSINQFRVAMPIMDSLGFPGTFFINTGNIPGSKYQAEFIGRPQEDIVKESAITATDRDNLFERASMVAYAPYSGMQNYFTTAGELYEAGKIDEACRKIDEALAAIRTGKAKPRRTGGQGRSERITWDDIRIFANKGHEFASHTITHPRLAIMDSANLVNELEGSRKEILEQLGEKFTFSAECPYGTEDERVMEFAYKYYPALRNRMPETFLLELNRGSRKSPVNNEIEYVQWQRGALTSTTMELMKAWIDTTAAINNIWLVLVFHGVDGIGWEPLTGDDLRNYYNYIKSNEHRLWIATFGDVAKYIRERMNSRLETTSEKGRLTVSLSAGPGKEYDYPLTLKTYLSGSPDDLQIMQGQNEIVYNTGKDDRGNYVMYKVVPGSGALILSFR
jgi:peptidoglycan/xylan/chitin deacetylase (PgdA/CDA1 family)